MIVLGVDPGLRVTGYGCVRTGFSKHSLVEAGVIRLSRTDKEDGGAASVSKRLVELERDFCALLDRLCPNAVAVEAIFAHVAHPATAMIMGHARGVLLLHIAKRKLQLIELSPRLVKKTMTGSGRAEKVQMQHAVQEYFGLSELPKPPDVADALAIALCAAERTRLGTSLDDSEGLEASIAAHLLKPRKSAKAKRSLPRDVLER
ncbi:MAG: crossover junction endodeoxyribonuclease RuvC [Phycisphaerales bacterium]